MVGKEAEAAGGMLAGEARTALVFAFAEWASAVTGVAGGSAPVVGTAVGLAGGWASGWTAVLVVVNLWCKSLGVRQQAQWVEEMSLFRLSVRARLETCLL